MQRLWAVHELFVLSLHRERELKGDIARLTDQLEEQKTATQKTVLVGALKCTETLHKVLSVTVLAAVCSVQ